MKICKKYIQEINDIVNPVIEKYKKQAQIKVKTKKSK